MQRPADNPISPASAADSLNPLLNYRNCATRSDEELPFAPTDRIEFLGGPIQFAEFEPSLGQEQQRFEVRGLEPFGRLEVRAGGLRVRPHFLVEPCPAGQGLGRGLIAMHGPIKPCKPLGLGVPGVPLQSQVAEDDIGLHLRRMSDHELREKLDRLVAFILGDQCASEVHRRGWVVRRNRQPAAGNLGDLHVVLKAGIKMTKVTTHLLIARPDVKVPPVRAESGADLPGASRLDIEIRLRVAEDDIEIAGMPFEVNTPLPGGLLPLAGLSGGFARRPGEVGRATPVESIPPRQTAAHDRQHEDKNGKESPVDPDRPGQTPPQPAGSPPESSQQFLLQAPTPMTAAAAAANPDLLTDLFAPRVGNLVLLGGHPESSLPRFR